MTNSSPMDQIIPGLWIGDWQAARAAHSLLAVTVAADSPFEGTYKFPLVDGPGNDASIFLNAVACVCEIMQGDQSAIVHCIAGRSRSCAVVVGALIQSQGLSLCEAYDLVKQKRPSMQIHPAFAPLMEMVKSVEAQDRKRRKAS